MEISESEKSLYRRIDEILYFIWDPKGVSRSVSARDEYEAYLSQVFGRIMRGCSRDEMIQYLTKMETEHMGLGRNPNLEVRTGVVADLLLELKDELFLGESE